MKKYLQELDIKLICRIVCCVAAGMLVGIFVHCFTNLVELTNSSTVVPTTQVVENSVDNVNNYAYADELMEKVEKRTPGYTEEQLEILAIIIYQEAGGDRYTNEIRRMVGSVFLNRVNSDLFPDTFEAVATQRKQYGTLYRTGIKWPDRATNLGEIHAVKRAYAIADELLINGSILPENVIYQAEFKQGSGVYKHLDDIYFCYM